MLRMVDLLMRMRRALCWMHLEAICRLCSSLDFPTMLAMALNSAVMGNFLGLSFLWVIPVELSLWTGQTETWLILCLPALPGKNRSNRFPPLTIVHSIRLCVCCCCCALWFVVLLWCVVLVFRTIIFPKVSFCGLGKSGQLYTLSNYVPLMYGACRRSQKLFSHRSIYIDALSTTMQENGARFF